MNDKELFDQVLELRNQNKNYCEISRLTGVNRRTVMDWCKGKSNRDKLKSKHKKSTHKTNDEDFTKYVKESFSIAEVMRKCGLTGDGANYRVFKVRVKNLNLDTSHFTGQAYLKGKHNPYTSEISIEEAFVKGGSMGSLGLRKKILKYKLKEYICDICKLDMWLSNPIVLQLDHIDGDNMNNELSNLRFLCPNCHSQTSTFAGKNKNKNGGE